MSTKIDWRNDPYYLDRQVEFDLPFRVDEVGNVEVAGDVYAPDVFHDEQHSMTIDGIPYRDSEEWEALTGWTGQHGYNGPVMHQSEFLGGGLAQHVLDTPGVYVVVAVEVEEEWREATEAEAEAWFNGTLTPLSISYRESEHGLEVCDDVDPFPAGWAILRRRDTN